MVSQNQSANRHHLLFIDDDTEVLSVNSKYFRQHSYLVSTASTADQALNMLADTSADCIIMDIMMPGIDGFQALPLIRQISNAPVIFLTGRAAEKDKIRGLLSGADDYMVKPYSFRELEARIQVVLRRYHAATVPPASGNILDYSPLLIDMLAHKVYYNQDEIALSAKEYQFLQLLAASPGQDFTFMEIGNALWGTYLESDRKTIMVTASRLRKKLAAYTGLDQCIETVWSKGYRFSKGTHHEL